MFKCIDNLIKRLYNKCGHIQILGISIWYYLPCYIIIGKWELAVYAMNLDWDSLRIKISKDHDIKYIIKKGIY